MVSRVRATERAPAAMARAWLQPRFLMGDRVDGAQVCCHTSFNPQFLNGSIHDSVLAPTTFAKHHTKDNSLCLFKLLVTLMRPSPTSINVSVKVHLCIRPVPKESTRVYWKASLPVKSPAAVRCSAVGQTSSDKASQSNT